MPFKSKNPRLENANVRRGASIVPYNRTKVQDEEKKLRAVEWPLDILSGLVAIDKSRFLYCIDSNGSSFVTRE